MHLCDVHYLMISQTVFEIGCVVTCLANLHTHFHKLRVFFDVFRCDAHMMQNDTHIRVYREKIGQEAQCNYILLGIYIPHTIYILDRDIWVITKHKH